MTKIEPPKTESKDNEYSKLDAVEMKSKLAELQEALKSDTFKDIDARKALGFEPADIKITEKTIEKSVNDEAIKRLLPILEETRAELLKAGYEFPSDTKMSEGEKQLHTKLEQLALAKFGESKAEVLKVDPDYPVKDIEDLKIPTEAKISVMAVNKGIAERNVEAVSKIKKEFDATQAELKEVKLSSPAEPKKDATGTSKVNEALAKFGMKVEDAKDKKSEEKKE